MTFPIIENLASPKKNLHGRNFQSQLQNFRLALYKSGFRVPKDTQYGVVVAKSTELKDIIKDMGHNLVKEVAYASNGVVCDGEYSRTFYKLESKKKHASTGKEEKKHEE